jgi:hypothetical protein
VPHGSDVRRPANAIGQQNASVSLADLDVQVITAPTVRLEGHAQSGAA